VAAGGWAVWSVANGPGEPTTTAANAVSPTDALQEELLHRNIERPGDPLLGARFQLLNVRHFGGALPMIPVVWEPELAAVGHLAEDRFRLEGMFGLVGSRSMILLNTRLQGDEKALDRALSHEMVHAYLHATGDSITTHGPSFQAVLERLAAEGAFEGIRSTADERASLRSWLDAETERLEQERQQLNELEPGIEQERAAIERAVTDVGAASAAAAAATTSPSLAASAGEAGKAASAADGATAPGLAGSTGSRLASDGDLRALEARRAAYNARAAEANARVDRYRAARDELSRQIARYNLMLVYPDGLDKADGRAAR
jgi:hypothetical protein